MHKNLHVKMDVRAVIAMKVLCTRKMEMSLPMMYISTNTWQVCIPFHETGAELVDTNLC